jgi:hypothetical protein
MVRASLDGNDVTAAKSAPIGRVYRMSWWFRSFALFFLVFGLVFALSFGRDFLEGHDQEWTKILIAMAFPIIGAGITIRAFSSRIAFTADSVDKSWVMGRRRMALDTICGRREYVVRGKNGSTRYLQIVANDGSAPLDFGKQLYGFDDAFWHWFNQLPDLDARDKEEPRDSTQHKDSNFGLV